MFVRVHQILSIRNLNGDLGKRIELVQEEKIPRSIIGSQTEEAKVVQNIFQAVQQQIPILPQTRQIEAPKIILFFTEQEYESLGINFEVNQIYEITLENQTIKFQNTHRG